MLAYAAATGTAVAQPPGKVPAGLDVVPADGFAFVSVNVAEVWDTAGLKGVREAIFALGRNDAAFEKATGASLAELDRATFLWPLFPTRPRGEAPIIVVTTRKPFDQAKVLKALEAETFADAERRRGEKKMMPKLPGGGIKKGFDSKDFPPFPGKGETAPFPIKKEPVAHLRQREKPPAEAGDDAMGGLYLCRKLQMTLYLMDASTVVLLPFPEGDELQMVAMLAKILRRKAEGPLSDALAVADKHTAVAGLDFRPVRRELTREDPLHRELVPFRSLLKTDGGFATLDLDAKSVLTATLRFPTADDAAKAEPVLKTAIQFVAEELGQLKAEITPQAKEFAEPLFDALLGSLGKATVKQSEKQLVTTASLTLGEPIETALKAMPAFAKVQAEEAKTANNLKQIALALWNYHDTMGHFPQDIVDKAGKPILSWRVQILPYLEQNKVHRQFDLTKAWDDPANAKLLAETPAVFQVPGRAGKDGETYFQMFTADKPIAGGSPVLVRGQKRTVAGITDGTSNTFGVVEAAEGVNWAKPADLLFDPKKLPPLGDPKTGKFRVSMLDGSVRSFRRDKITGDQLRAFITADGGEVNTYGDEK